MKQPRRPRKPQGIKRDPVLPWGRRPGLKPVYSPNQTQRYQSRSLRYSKAVELSKAGPDFVQTEDGRILNTDDIESLREDLKRKESAPRDRYLFRYTSARAPKDYWTVEYAPSDDGGGGNYPPIEVPEGLEPWPGDGNTRLIIWAWTDFGLGLAPSGYDDRMPGYVTFTVDAYQNANITSEYYWGPGFPYPPWATGDAPAARYPIPWNSSVRLDYPPFGPPLDISEQSVEFDLRYEDHGWLVCFVNYPFRFHELASGSIRSIRAGLWLAYGRSDLAQSQPSDPFGNFPWEKVYDRIPDGYPGGSGGPPLPGGGGGAGGGGGNEEGWRCDCPDYTRTQGTLPRSPFNSETVPRDWSSTNAGCDVEYGCKHIVATKLFLDLPVEVPGDYPLS